MITNKIILLTHAPPSSPLPPPFLPSTDSTYPLRLLSPTSLIPSHRMTMTKIQFFVV